MRMDCFFGRRRQRSLVTFAFVAAAFGPLSVKPLAAQEDDSPGGAPFGDIAEIPPSSPVAGGNDANASASVLYTLNEEEEDEDEIAEDEKGIIKENGQPAGVRTRNRTAPRTHFFVNPSVRAAVKAALTPNVSVEVFTTGGSGDFRENTLNFGTRATNISGGVSTTVNFGLVNGAFAFEHRDAYGGQFGPWKSTGDKVGATFNKTLPLFVSNLTLTPQIVTTRDAVDPIRASSESVEPSAGLTYTVNPQLSFALSPGYSMVFLYGLPGYRRDDGLKLTLGATFKAMDRLVLTLGATTNRTILYGLPTYRADRALSPMVLAKYAIGSYLSLNISANYGRFLSTVSGGSTFKYNINPSLNLTIPL